MITAINMFVRDAVDSCRIGIGAITPPSTVHILQPKSAIPRHRNALNFGGDDGGIALWPVIVRKMCAHALAVTLTILPLMVTGCNPQANNQSSTYQSSTYQSRAYQYDYDDQYEQRQRKKGSLNSTLSLYSGIGDENKVREALSQGADVNATNGEPLNRASYSGNANIVRLLIERGANVNAKLDGSTALHAAVHGGYTAIAKTLLDHGANINSTDKNGKTPLHVAAGCCVVSKGMIETLLMYNPDINIKDDSGRTPLEEAFSDNKKFLEAAIRQNKAARSRAVAATEAKSAMPKASAIPEPNHPPEITLRSIPTTTDQTIEITGRVSSKGRITSLSVDSTDVRIQPDGTFSVRRGIPLGDSEIKLAATDEWGQTGDIRVKVKRIIASTETTLPPLASSRVHGNARPKAIALIIGIEKYKSTPPAEFAENDARSFYDYAINALGVPASRVKLLTGADAQRVDVEAAILTWLKPQVVKGQTEVFVFFSGHGLASDDGKDLYLLPQDGNRALLDRSALRRKELIDMIVDSGAKAATLFLDTCYSGGTRGKETLVSSARPILVAAKEQAVPPNVTILAAAGNDQLSSSLVAAKHGLFSYFLMKGLEGEAAGSDHTITAAKLGAYLAEKIPSEAAKLGRTQTPQLIGDGSKVISSW